MPYTHGKGVPLKKKRKKNGISIRTQSTAKQKQYLKAILDLYVFCNWRYVFYRQQIKRKLRRHLFLYYPVYQHLRKILNEGIFYLRNIEKIIY